MTWKREDQSTDSKSRERISADFKGTLLDPIEEPPKDAFTRLLHVRIDLSHRLACRWTHRAIARLIIQNNSRDRLMFQDLPQDSATRKSAFLTIITSTDVRDNLGPMVDDVIQRDGIRRLGAVRWLEP